MRFLFLIVLIYALPDFLAGQDVLYKKDNSKYEVKITEITPTEVKYKLKSHPDGPLYVIYKSDVALIIYENGQHETFPEAKPPVQIQPLYTPYSSTIKRDSLRAQRKKENLKKFELVTKTKNAIFINSLGLINFCASFSLYREISNSLFSIHLPFSFSFAEHNMNYRMVGVPTYYGNPVINHFYITTKSIDIGLGIYFNTSGKKAITHFVGPLFRFAQYNGKFDVLENYGINYLNGYNTLPIYRTHGFVMNETYLMINNGFLFRITPHFNLMMHAAIGITTSRHFAANNPENFNFILGSSYYGGYQNPQYVFHTGFSAGYRF